MSRANVFYFVFAAASGVEPLQGQPGADASFFCEAIKRD